MLRQKVSTAACLILVSSFAQACLWIEGITAEGQKVRLEGVPLDRLLVPEDKKEQAEQVMHALRAKVDAQTASAKEVSDFAGALTLLGRYEQALALLKKAESEKPGLYEVAANLGTTYELSGDDAEGLRWIREAVRRNPSSHSGTEWLHIAILEAKIKLTRDRKWLVAHCIADFDFGTQDRPAAPRLPAGRTKTDCLSALIYQLNERVDLVAPPDPIVADLFFALGNFAASTRPIAEARFAYEQSLRYGHPQTELVQSRLRWLATADAKNESIIRKVRRLFD